MTTESTTSLEELDREALLERLRVSESRRALAEAKLAIARLAHGQRWDPETEAGRRARVRLGDVEPALDVLFHTAKVALVLMQADSTILRANQHYADLMGRPLTSLAGMRSVDLTAPLDRAATVKAIGAAAEGQVMLKQYERPDGSHVTTLAMGWPLVDDDGQMVCLFGVAVPLDRVTVPRAELEQLLDALVE